MTRTYKLASNFNTVEFTITEEDYFDYANPIKLANDLAIEEGYPEEPILSYEEWLQAKLQEEYDILASIKPIEPINAPRIENKAPTSPIKPSGVPKYTLNNKKPSTAVYEAPTEAQISFAESLGIVNAAEYSKKELWALIKEMK